MEKPGGEGGPCLKARCRNENVLFSNGGVSGLRWADDGRAAPKERLGEVEGYGRLFTRSKKGKGLCAAHLVGLPFALVL